MLPAPLSSNYKSGDGYTCKYTAAHPSAQLRFQKDAPLQYVYVWICTREKSRANRASGHLNEYWSGVAIHSSKTNYMFFRNCNSLRFLPASNMHCLNQCSAKSGKSKEKKYRTNSFESCIFPIARRQIMRPAYTDSDTQQNEFNLCILFERVGCHVATDGIAGCMRSYLYVNADTDTSGKGNWWGQRVESKLVSWLHTAPLSVPASRWHR